MDRLLLAFRRTAIILLSAYAVLLALFILGLFVERQVGFGNVPFGFGQYIGNFCLLMYWLQLSLAKLIFQALPIVFAPAFLKAGTLNRLTALIVGNLVNALLIVFLSFCLAAIYCLSEAVDRTLAGSFDDRNNGD